MPNVITIGFYILAIILLICIVIAVVMISKNKLKELTFTQKEIPKFSVNVQFNPYPQTVNIENKYDCNVKSLRVCKLDDSTTLFGCKELIVRCHHFDKDTPYIENNETITVPKNSSPNEGYALAITAITDACNPYHGDLTLISANAESSEYMLICVCKNPGYIGNESLLGNCTSIFICNGEIDSIDKPLNNINCVCKEREKNVRYSDGLPVCKELLVHEANDLYDDWSNIVPWNSNRQLDTSNFNPTISGNLKTSRLLNPCSNSIHDTSIAIPDAYYDRVQKQCRLTDSGFPIANNMLTFKGTDNKDIGISSVLATKKYNRVRFSDHIAGERKILGIVVNGIAFYDKYKNTEVVLHPQNGFRFGMGVGISFNSGADFITMTCDGHFPGYDCTPRVKLASVRGGLAIPNGRECPSSFLWNREPWYDNEFLVMRSVDADTVTGIRLSPKKLTNIDDIQSYGIQWAPSSSNELNGILVFFQNSDYMIHKRTITG